MKTWQKKRAWDLIVNRTYLPLSLSFSSFDTSKKYLDQILSVPVADIYASYRDDNYYGKGSKEAFAEVQIEGYRRQGIIFLEKMAKVCRREGGKLLDFTLKKSREKISLLSNRTLAKRLMDFSNKERAFCVFLLYVWSLEDFLDEGLDQILDRYVKNLNDHKEWKKKLSEPIDLNYGQHEQLSLLKIASNLQSEDDLERPAVRGLVTRHVNRYGWLPIRWLKGKPMTNEEVVQRLRKLIDEGGAASKLKALKHKVVDVNAGTQEFKREFGVSLDDVRFIQLIKEFVFLRTFRTDIINKSVYLMIPLFKECAARLHISYDDILYLTPEEIYAGLIDGQLSASVDLSSRQKDWALLRDSDDVIILGGKDARDFASLQGFIVDDRKEVKEFKGESAFHGVIQGRAKLVLSPEDISKVQKGDIMIAVMTYPSYIAAMERASAFVTDEGGILCHAAIVAREMKKPCIIGTQIATKVLKDGDVVEVDADKGSVKKIK